MVSTRRDKTPISCVHCGVPPHHECRLGEVLSGLDVAFKDEEGDSPLEESVGEQYLISVLALNV